MTTDAVSFAGLLGYLNFSAGKPDPRFQKQFADLWATIATPETAQPWRAVYKRLIAELAQLKTAGAAALQDSRQVEAVLPLVFDQLLPAYRRHHADLLFHQSDADLFQVGFVLRACEAVLAQGGPWDEETRIVVGALKQLNDYVGYRPIAVLETRPRGEPYDHEKVRPLPLYLRGVGVLPGKYREVVAIALEVLNPLDKGLLAEASFDPNLLDELAYDPRAYDHGDPADRRPNYRFGEWDPHQIDNQGRYRRYVARQMTLDALLARLDAEDGKLPREELLTEAGIVFACTVLMGAGVSGWGPGAHDSSVTLSTLLPRVAKYREGFYNTLLPQLQGRHGERLRQEATRMRQPFAGARQHVNHYLARQRATQLQQRHLALVLAEMGFPEESRRQASLIPAASVRMRSEMHLRLALGQFLADRGELTAAAKLLPEVEELLHRGIACGALVDPWNILGFQGLFPLFQSMEDSVQDPRVAHLVQTIERMLGTYARLRSEAAAQGEAALGERLAADMGKLAAWWDRFASVEVSEVRRVHGGEAASSAEQVALALTHWRERGAAAADLAFWRQHLDEFRTPKAFALVVDALLRKEDFKAAMALLVNWLSQAEQVPLEDNEHSFPVLALRWMLGVVGQGGQWPLIVKFLDYLEANAEDYWNVPRLDLGDQQHAEEGEEEDEEEALYGAAYEDVTYQDSTDDDVEGDVMEVGPSGTFDLQDEGERLEKRLHFLATLARLWNIATRGDRLRAARAPLPPDQAATLTGWLAQAQRNYQDLLALMDAIQDYPIPEPVGSFESMVEFERRRTFKERLLGVAVATCLDIALASGALQGALDLASTKQPREGKRPAWEPALMRMEQALWRGDGQLVGETLPVFIERFQREPLLVTPLGGGGHPRQLLRASIAQTILRALLANLPRIGLVRETFDLLSVVRGMEDEQSRHGPRMPEFYRLYHVALDAVAQSVVASASAGDEPLDDPGLVELLVLLIKPFSALWIEQSGSWPVSVLETVQGDKEWAKLRSFIQKYGGDLFHVKFMTEANLSGILHRGIRAFLAYLEEHPDPLRPIKLIDDLERGITRPEAERCLHLVVQALIENYREYKDYNTTTPHSDFGQHLHSLMDFLRLKASYDRQAWHVRPLAMVHEVLARERPGAARLWLEQFAQMTREPAERYLQELERIEKAHGFRLNTIADHLRERFVKPLALDRLCAQVEPAMNEARRGETHGAALTLLLEELKQHAEEPTGVGLDVPHWLRRLEAEVHRVQQGRTEIAGMALDLFEIPRVVAPLDEVRRQLENWDRRLADDS